MATHPEFVDGDDLFLVPGDGSVTAGDIVLASSAPAREVDAGNLGAPAECAAVADAAAAADILPGSRSRFGITEHLLCQPMHTVVERTYCAHRDKVQLFGLLENCRRLSSLRPHIRGMSIRDGPKFHSECRRAAR